MKDRSAFNLKSVFIMTNRGRLIWFQKEVQIIEVYGKMTVGSYDP